MNNQKEIEEKRIKVLFCCWRGREWMGGVYYIKNMIFALIQDKSILENLDIYVYIPDELNSEFKAFEDIEHITFVGQGNFSKLDKIYIKLGRKLEKFRWFSHYSALLNVLMKRVHANIIFPMCIYNKKYNDISISWIPDFQHLHFPQYFSAKQYKRRSIDYFNLAKNHRAMILSSEDAKRDYISVYPEYSDGVYVVPFVSAIDESLLSEDRIREVQEKYNISDEYFIVSNQYWMHKDHETLFNAVAYAKKELGVELRIVLTGRMEDSRNPDYISKLNSIITNNNLGNNIIQLGLISRDDQIQLMKGARAVVQPSLFEGWGTVVEDAKTLNKVIVLSDIPVHKEQMYGKCVLFKKQDSVDLANVLCTIARDGKNDELRIYDYKKQAQEYGRLLYDSFLTIIK